MINGTIVPNRIPLCNTMIAAKFKELVQKPNR